MFAGHRLEPEKIGPFAPRAQRAAAIDQIGLFQAALDDLLRLA